MARAAAAAAAPAPPPRAKAALRGVSHSYAAAAAAGAGAVLALAAPPGAPRAACAVYAAALFACFATSALYHMPTWSVAARARLRRADHSAIYLLIAGTYTPLCVMALDRGDAARLLARVWGGAAAGVAAAAAPGPAPKWLMAALYVALGWAALPYASQMRGALGPAGAALVLAGGLVYTGGALVYAARRPDPWPRTFGYHEIFHAMVVAAALLHFAAVWLVVDAAAAAATAAGCAGL
jgi:hemolysin III